MSEKLQNHERPAISLEEKVLVLRKIFEGNPVKITHTNNSSLKDMDGVCKTFHITENGIDMELVNGVRIGFFPETITENSVECSMAPSLIAGTRKIELAQ